jgi:hypothetical protein
MKLKYMFPCSKCGTPATHWGPLSGTERLYECRCTGHKYTTDTPIPAIGRVKENGDDIELATYLRNEPRGSSAPDLPSGE